MGVVNQYIDKLMDFIKNKTIDPEKAWLKYYNKMPEHLSYSQGSIYDAIKNAASLYPKNIAYRYFGYEVSYRGFLKKIDKIASCLKQFDIVENECVTMCLPNSPESFALFYAINKIGAIANIVHPLSSTADIERALKETNSSILFVSDASMPKARGIKVKHFIMVPTSFSFKGILKLGYNIKEAANLKLDEGMISFSDFLLEATNDEVYVKRDGTDPAAIIYSGGTTGKPKGIIISNLNFNAMALQTRTVCDIISPGNSVLAALPIFHVFGLALCCHTCLSSGMTCIIVPRLNTKAINMELKKYKPNVYPAVPSLLKMSLDGIFPGRAAFKDIKVVVVGGDYLSPKVKEDFEEFLKKCGSNAVVKVGYGLSEATGFSACTAAMDEKDVINGTLGIPNPDMDIKVIELNSDVEKAYGEIGELCISGPTIMMGYINESEETKKTLILHSDGKVWLHTGDLGYRDENGLFFYSSRLKRMIITNGYNVYPVELEEIISKCEYVKACTVVGVPHKTKGQTPKAVIVLKDGVEENIEIRSKIRKYCKENLANYAVPTEFEYRITLPVTAVGKVAYRDLEKNKTKK